MNEFYWVVMLALNFVMILVAFRLWGKLGLYIWVPISVIVANIQVTKTVVLFNLDATLGNIVYATGFLATDILSELYGKKESAKAVGIGFFSLLAMTILMQASLFFEPASSDIAHSSLSLIFGLMPRIAFGSLIAYVVSNLHDIWAFDYWKRRRPGRQSLWLRNNLSTLVSQLIDTLVFTFIAFWGVFPAKVLTGIIISTYLLKWVVALLDTPFMYLARSWHEKGKIPTPSI